MHEHEYAGEYTYGDLVLANRIHYLSKRSTKILSVLILLILLLPILVLIGNPRDGLSWAFAVILITLLGYPYTILPILARRSFGEQRQLHREVKIRLSEGQIFGTGATGEGTVRWLHHYILSDRMLLLYETPSTFMMLPRRFARDDSEFEYARQFLQTFPCGKEEPGKAESSSTHSQSM